MMARENVTASLLNGITFKRKHGRRVDNIQGTLDSSIYSNALGPIVYHSPDSHVAKTDFPFDVTSKSVILTIDCKSTVVSNLNSNTRSSYL